MNATLYCTRPLSFADVRAAASGWDVRAGSGREELATLTSPRGRVTLSSMPARELAQHLAGLKGYVASTCTVHDETFEQRVDNVAQVIGWMIDCDDVESLDRLIFDLAARGGAMLFDGASFISHERKLLAGPGEDQLEPPTPERVLRRAWALAAVAMRAYLEDPRATKAEEQLRELRAFIAAVRLDDELEPDERALLDAPRGTLTQQQQVEGSWRSEGVVVLAWALGGAVLPDHETQGDPFEASRSVGFLGSGPGSVTLRSPEELDREGRRALGIHWRLREFSLRKQPVDFEKFSREAWFGGFDLAGIPLAEGDLAVGGVPITRAKQQEIGMCHSIAMERHLAFNWLLGANPIYSEVDTST